MSRETRGMLLGLIGICGFGLTLPVTRVAVTALDPIFIGLGRAAVAALFAALFLLLFHQPIPRKRQLIPLTIVALGVVIGFPVFSSWSMQYVPSSHGAVMLGILPLITAAVGVLIGNERPSMGFWLMSIFGSLLVIIFALQKGAGALHIADFALLAATLSAAVGYAVGAKLSNEMGGWQVICWALVLSFPFIIMPTLNYAPDAWLSFKSSIYISFLYLALVSQLLAFFVWYQGLSLGGIARVSQTQLLQPFITIFAAFFIFNESIDMLTITFALMLVISVWVGKKMTITEKQMD